VTGELSWNFAPSAIANVRVSCTVPTEAALASLRCGADHAGEGPGPDERRRPTSPRSKPPPREAGVESTRPARCARKTAAPPLVHQLAREQTRRGSPSQASSRSHRDGDGDRVTVQLQCCDRRSPS
jgi:hypothetical protein